MTTAATATIQGETDFATEIKVGTETKIGTETGVGVEVKTLEEDNDGISVTARATVIVTDMVAVTEMKVDQDRGLLNDANRGQKTNATRRKEKRVIERTEEKKKRNLSRLLRLRRVKSSSSSISMTVSAPNRPSHACHQTLSGSSSS